MQTSTGRQSAEAASNPALSLQEFNMVFNKIMGERPAILSQLHTATLHADVGEQSFGHMARKSSGKNLRLVRSTPVDVVAEGDAGNIADAIAERYFFAENLEEGAVSAVHDAEILRAVFTERYTTSLVTMIGLPTPNADAPEDDTPLEACSWPVLHQVFTRICHHPSSLCLASALTSI